MYTPFSILQSYSTKRKIGILEKTKKSRFKLDEKVDIELIFLDQFDQLQD